MHLNIDLELNKLNSNLYEIILPQEKDYFLNRAQLQWGMSLILREKTSSTKHAPTSRK